MSNLEIETTPQTPVAAEILETPPRNGDLNLNGSAKHSSPKTEDTPATSPNTVHLTGDLKLSLESKAPPVQNPYSMAQSMVDLPCAAYALELFLASHMLESEDYMNKSDPKKYHIIHALKVTILINVPGSGCTLQLDMV